jgi:hypothetical protein
MYNQQERVGGGFYSAVLNAFLYPLTKEGLVIIVVGAITYSIVIPLSSIPFIGWGISFVATAYLTATMMNVLDSSADGHQELPDYPDLTSVYEDVFLPWFRWSFTFIFCMLPAIVGMIWASFEVAVAAALLGLVYLPMGLISVSLHRSIVGLHPLLVFPAIVKAPLQYAVAVFLVMVAAGLGAAVQAGIGMAGGASILMWPLVLAVMLYTIFVQARVLGLLYYFNREDISWFGEGEYVY